MAARAGPFGSAARTSLAALCVVIGIFTHPIAASPAETSEPPGSKFRVALPGYVFAFPRDHGAHPSFQTEWWYYTGHIRAEDGRRFGYQLTFFRRALRPRLSADAGAGRSKWRVEDLYFAHLALSDQRGGRFRFADRISREGLGKAGAEEDRLHVWIDRWSTRMAGGDAPHHLVADTDDVGLELDLAEAKPPVIHGTGGVSRKGARTEQASHYYSLSRLETAGLLTIDGRSFRVTGQSWMDHEFGSGDLSDELVGWDWFSLQLQSGEELMLYRLRRTDGQADLASSGTWIDRQGHARFLPADAVQVEILDHWTSPHSHAVYPSRWRVTIPSLDAAFDILPMLADQELRTERSTRITYWEGAVHMTGTLHDRPASGEGYVELTGYAERYLPRQ